MNLFSRRIALSGICVLFSFYLFANDSTLIKPKQGNLILPAGFSSTVIAERIGRARHLVVTKAGDIIVRLARTNKGVGTIILRDNNKDGVIDDSSGFGGYGGTGIAIKNG